MLNVYWKIKSWRAYNLELFGAALRKIRLLGQGLFSLILAVLEEYIEEENVASNSKAIAAIRSKYLKLEGGLNISFFKMLLLPLICHKRGQNVDE